jgi:mercuric ion binding protein
MKKLITVVLAVLFIALAGVAAAAIKTVTLSVPDMTCAVCPITVKKALNRVSGVSHTEVSYERREAVVTFDDAKTNVEALIQATTNAGYPASVKAK